MVGILIGNYRVTRKIGDGGMGSVFEAVHEGIGRRVAVKVLHPRYSQDPNVVARFFNEARAVNIIQQPGIVGIFDFGTLPDGRAYLTMEYLEGESLGTRLRRLGRLGGDALRVARQIAGTLAAAHARGIIHRDLKPDNIYMVPDMEAPGGERAKVLDFGIAKIVSDGGTQDGTQAGAVMGTPKYMSPEQCQCSAQVDPKTDVYSLGVVLFELLTGRLPFISDNTGGLLAAHIHKEPPPLRTVDPSIPVPIESLVLAMMAKAPAARPTMADVASTLEMLAPFASAALPVFASGVSAVIGPSGQHAPVPSLPPITGSTSRLSGMAAEAAARPARPAWRLLGPALLMLVVFVGSLAGLRARRAHPEGGAAVTAGPLQKVRWTLESQPAGAQVYRLGDDQHPLGQTPYSVERVLGAGRMALVLRREGFYDKQIMLEQGRDQRATVTLDPLPGAAPPPVPEAAAAAPAKVKPADDLPPLRVEGPGKKAVRAGKRGKQKVKKRPAAPGAQPAPQEEHELDPVR